MESIAKVWCLVNHDWENGDEDEDGYGEEKEKSWVCSQVFGWVESLGQSACHILTQHGCDKERVVCEDKVGWDDAEH